ncbi:major facilitator superfamily domain-containing protein [Neohortaea acidophila]|uniref:Major facilitator superfamily domain-containing protein n=1 Tax=Neohortaea acidophila TaxID=245834 RepID=A0A6A6PM34_9PEZI|nr:major facilitator superfamily domain-containing protein [Neohortaea acidophila]KAF2480965.1 major facilitator superfamily domain-containing protein [Neohortaea acidophila]
MCRVSWASPYQSGAYANLLPGTATLEAFDELANVPGHVGVKRSKQGIILVPQPSDDPDDPLNWPLWRRDLIVGILCLLSVIASTLSPLLACNTLTLDLYFEKSFTDIALLTGYHLLGVAVAGFIFVASARVWGKRHLYILGAFIIIWSSAWGGASNHNYNSLLAARFFQGVGLAPFEALVNASVGDLYFVHERGKRMALSNLSLFGGAFFTPVIVGTITEHLGWQWTFYFIAIFTAVMFPLIVLFVPETAFVRDAHFNTDLSTTIDADEKPRMQEEVSAPEARPAAKMLSKQNLRLFNGRKTDESFWKLLLRPFPLFLHPGILWACLIQGTLIGWTVLIGIVIATIAFTPPIFFNEAQTGYLYTGAFIGALLGFVLAGLLSDSSAKFLTKRNGGIYEPEFRMILVIPQLIFGCAGIYGVGITGADVAKFGWFWPDFFFALEVLGMVLGAVASALYIVDAHRELAVEGFTCLLIFKNIFSFGLTFSGFHWIQTVGIKPVFLAIGSVQVVICFTTVFMYVFGKKNRSFMARHDILKLCRLR